MQDQYYNVRGQAFVIPRVEERENEQPTCTHRAKFVRHKHLPARQARPAPGTASLSLIQQAVAQNPMGLTLISDGPLVDVDVEREVSEAMPDAPGVDGMSSQAATAETAVAVAAAPVAVEPVQPTTCTGIVHVPTSSVDAEESDLFQTSSTSPRRTKMLRFTCLANGCRAVNIKPISPESFASGTVFAQCAKCEEWHLIRDHLSLWDQSKRTVYRNGKRVKPISLEEIPSALRPSVEDLDFFANGGKVAGWEQGKREDGKEE